MKKNCVRCCMGYGLLLLATVVLYGFFLVTPVVVYADPPTDTTVVGDTVTDPITGTDATVNGLIQDDNGTTYAVTIEGARLIYTTTEVGDTLPDDDGDWTVKDITTNDYGYVDSLSLEREVPDPDDPDATITQTQTLTVAQDYDTSNPVDENGNPINPDGAAGIAEHTVVDPPQTASGDNNEIYRRRPGSSGDDGRDGYGVKVCAFGHCATVAHEPKPGKNGSKPAPLEIIVPSSEFPLSSHNPIETVSSKLAGITALSNGGDGGKGGDAYGNIPAEHGGKAGAGGQVTVSTGTTITTTGYKGHGVFAQSRAGKAGDGGTGYFWSEGGSGGGPAYGGVVSVTNTGDGTISTTGNKAYGIFAQSIGGSAGDGGDSWGIVGIGGSSDVAGDGGHVAVIQEGYITTTGSASHGIFAQSLGGTGGDGGSGGGILGHGGFGSLGGNGGTVSVHTFADSVLETHGKGAHGILAQSIGGGGGNGGIGAGITGLGSDGASGGEGADVNITHDGLIVTHGEGAIGVLAQSIGGGGGNAGVGAGIVGLGGSGSGGGNGAEVTFTSSNAQSSIITWGDSSHGILAQSIGGGGGVGGVGAGLVAIGGSGGGGGNGGKITVNSSTSVITHGESARGVYVQSIGGGGGSGSGSGGAVAIGGSGSGGGDGGRISVNNSANITTGIHLDNNGQFVYEGSHSDGLFFQSIGGGGGSGGGSGGAVSLGGNGGGGGDAGVVTAANSGMLTTGGDYSCGIFIQSIGGGGGSGAGSGGAVSLGGDGGGGGNGNWVNVSNSGIISTFGLASDGLFVQSIGGGGGDGSGSGGLVSLGGNSGVASDGGKVSAANSGTVITRSDEAAALFVQSIGGGGGRGMGSGGIVSLGGDGGAGGDGGKIDVTNTNGTLQTAGENAQGIFAQSIGGGGGFGGGSGGVVSLGGDGGSGGNGAAVTVISSGGIIVTEGNNAEAIFAQSVGGGGGSGSGSGGAVSLGGDGSGGGTSGVVKVTNSSALHTRGDNAEGIFAQSIGGGGGSGAGSGGAVSLGGRSGTASNGNMVTVVNNGLISTKSEGSDAIFAQSVGGGGGKASGGGGSGGLVSLGGNAGAGGDSNTVAVTNTNTRLQTEGEKARGIFAQSIGGGGGSGGGSGGAVSLGGDGGGGGDGANVTVTNTQTDITTFGNKSDAIFAQSVGGGGGDGAGSGGAVSLGGAGASGGSAGDIAVTSVGVLVTTGEKARGIFAQSVGGGGGNGAGSGGLVSLGGNSGGSGAAGSVTVIQGDGVAVGGIRTQGDSADAIFAQSVGGGGGNGAGTGGALSLGGSGSGGADGGEVQVTNFDNLLTSGKDSQGIFAQSVGGGGGNGGSVGGVITLGGSGSGASDGGAVRVVNSGFVRTDGGKSSAIFAQSVGGGGGNGGIAGGTFFSMGGSGGSGGNAGVVHVTNSNDLMTSGEDADGVFAQSIGGGGGNGGGAASGSAFAGLALGAGGGSAGNGESVSVTILQHTVAGQDVFSTLTTIGDRSRGIFAQSIGGGGGNGGFAVQGAAGTFGSVSVAIGGSGGNGGAGKDVSVDAMAQINTSGEDADGLVAQSVGGGGGNGGFSVSGAIQFNPVGGAAIDVGIGGSGGDGGAADKVVANLSGGIVTYGEKAGGLLAQSVGGGGGNGGFSIISSLSGGGAGSGAIAVGVGGSGGGGGNGAAVSSTVTGDILTFGKDADAFIAQSIGGGGGNGGFSIITSLSGGGVGSGAISVGVGGTGGGGGNGDNVAVDITGNIATSGEGSGGLLGQSVGGGGGNGGFTISTAGSGAGLGSGAIAVGVGGSGSIGGDGGKVTGSITGNTVTRGHGADGVVFQSIGGGGGNGGFNISGAISGAGGGSGSIPVGIGGAGAGGGKGNAVSARVHGDVYTVGKKSEGIVVQSVGGGGGNGGFDIAGAIAGAGIGSGGVAVGIGGAGGTGGAAGTVTATVDGFVGTTGNKAGGVVVQSVGGGGGNGGFSIDGVISGAGTGSGAVAVGIGGSGGSGGDAAAVTATMLQGKETSGNDSAAVLVQSVGGGGGNGGFDITGTVSGAGTGSGAVAVGIGGSGGGGGASSTVSADIQGNMLTQGKNSGAILVQSIGGGGGNGGFVINDSISGAGTGSGAVVVGIGGSGGSGGNAGSVTATVGSTITTSGAHSDAILVQSVGGGGGNGGFAISDSISGAGTGSGAVSVGIGGSGGGGGNASSVHAVVTGSMDTHSHDSAGVVVQSVGGGGGNGGLEISGSISGSGTGSGAVTVGIGGGGGDGGSGAAVELEMTGPVQSFGHDSAGVVAQSIGGGGGNGALSVADSVSLAGTGSGAVTVGIGGSGGGGGGGSSVTAALTGDLYTAGDNSQGFLAQSLGGGGGNGGINVSGAASFSETNGGSVGVGVGGFGGDGGDAADVSALMDGLLHTFGKDAVGMLAQSLGGGGGNGAVNVTGTVDAVGSGAGASVAMGLGGFGGGGGSADTVTLVRKGDSRTLGDGAVGIAAQSIGGGGGSGGTNVSGSVNVSLESGGAAVSVGLGGFGGDGGNSGNVQATVEGLVVTGDQDAGTGRDAIGVLAQSVAGSGGNGGTNVSGSLSVALNGTSASVGLGVGGFGGGGGTSGDVDLNTTGNVVTFGANGHGVVGQSIGGGGGNGGVNVAGAVDVTNTGRAYSAALGLGGFGGDGGNAGNVDVQVNGNVLSAGLGSDETIDIPDMVIDGETIPLTGYSLHIMKDGSHGVVGQSIGGGGGNGAVNVSGGISVANPTIGKTGSLVLGVGGFGGGGGNAGNVSVTLSGDAATAIGDNRSAVLAQSVGGGGGNGGLNVSGGIVMDGPLMIGVGGFGGDGGTAGNVSADVHSNLQAEGEEGIGLFAQSLGGGGGNGAINISGSIAANKKGTLPSVTFGVGGFGGAGAISGDVSVVQQGTIITNGKSGHGLLAQSIAGGGGNGGLNIASSINHSSSQAAVKKSNISFLVGIGGHAGAGADSGDVHVTSSGAITSGGDYGRGILAQSIGGGGGTGGLNVSTVVTGQGSPVIVGIGGFGGGGGNAGSVTVQRGDSAGAAGVITTNGKSAVGLEASSIGGGGGDAGMNFLLSYVSGGSSGTTGSTGSNPWSGKVDDRVITNYDKVIAELNGNSGSAASSDNQFAVQLAIGGAGGYAGQGDSVSVTDYSTITTQGFQSHGLLAQSIGGGGGNATLNIGLGYAPNAKAAKIALGGATGDGGNGAQVTVGHTGDITTTGKDAVGIIAQSIGGGGGNVGLDFVFNKTSAGAVALSIGRQGGTGGRGDAVSLDSEGSIQTQGTSAYGLLAQSVGNGGGNSSSYSAGVTGAETPSGEKGAAIAVGIEGGVGGEGGDVTLHAGGIIATRGERAHGIFAQSIGGGGGNAGTANAGSPMTAPSIGVSLGAKGGQGAAAGEVRVENHAGVFTYGEKSVAVLAQSIGGGGGTGSAAYGGGSKTSGSGVQVTVGGSGGTGADAGRVTVDNSGHIVTAAAEAHGVVAQSIGGGGGNAGLVINGLRNTSDHSSRIQVSVGGDGGTGGIGKQVGVTNTGSVITAGEQALGILAQSIGGGGGTGSTVITSSLNSASGTVTLALGIGGTGGSGGLSGDVSIDNFVKADRGNSGLVETTGDGAHGIFGLSVGGGGGSGSKLVTLVKSSQVSTSAPSTVLLMNIGGDGGDGGRSGRVEIHNQGQIITHGNEAHGIIAESIGGGGGNGGMNIAGNLVVGKASGTGLNSAISIGGNGGTGNRSGDVLVENSGLIETHGRGSCGVFAQSIGGGGGNSGTTVGVSVDPTVTTGVISQSSLLSIGIGGTGGDGGDAGDVRVNHTGSIATYGNGAHGIFAQSIGGGGGTSSVAYTSPFWMAGDFTYSSLLGGKESANGHGGDVTVVSQGNLNISGECSQGIVAQSINGGGGDATTYIDISEGVRSLDQEAVDIAEVTSVVEKLTAIFHGWYELGAENVRNMVGGLVTGRHQGDVTTTGGCSSGVTTQSVGGGGGSDTVKLVRRPQDSVDFHLGLGARDSGENPGGAISMEREGSIATRGENSVGYKVQSIGGGGGTLDLGLIGNGESATSSRTLAVPTFVRMGGIGGRGNQGGAVRLTMNGDIQSMGNRSQGLLVQSIGGGGGELRLTGTGSADVLLGGDQGAMGAGGMLDVSNNGFIGTEGTLAHALFLESIGGGGGALFTDLDGNEIHLTLADGGRGDGGSIALHQTGNLVTIGMDAYAAFAQSIGGGGGAVDTLFAGSAGGIGNGGDLHLVLTGDILTFGAGSKGFFAQSAAGSGFGGNIEANITGLTRTEGMDAEGIHVESTGSTGAGDIHVTTGSVVTLGRSSCGIYVVSDAGSGIGGVVRVDTRGDVWTLGSDSTAVFIQSTGWESGSGVSVYHAGNIVTLGDDAAGILAQSIGGGSGNSSVIVSTALVNPLFKAAPVFIHLGNNGGSGQNGGSVAFSMAGDLSTIGDNAQGIMVQSIGAGGGEVRLYGPGSVDLLLGAAQGGSGNGGDLTVMHTGFISTRGRLSHGIFLQSIGGGGGAVFSDQTGSNIHLILSHGGVGNGGDIRLVQNGSVYTRGRSAYGAFIQSLGGGGGAVDTIFAGSSHGMGNSGSIHADFMGDVTTAGPDSTAIFLQSAAGRGSSGKIDLLANGNVLATGKGSTAIYVESSGELGSGDITITLNGGRVYGGPGGGRGVAIVGGHNNVLTNHAVISTGDGYYGMAVSATTGNDTVNNYKTIIGNVDLGSGRNSFYNMRGAWMLSGPSLIVGSGNLVTNAGNISPGGSNKIMTTSLVGNFLQTSSGAYYVDLDFNKNRADLIKVSGKARVSGTVTLNTLHPEDLMPGNHTVRIVTGNAGVVNAGAGLDVRPSAVVDYQLVTPDARTLAIGLDIDFSPMGLTGNQSAIGAYFNALQLAGGTESMDPYIRYMFGLSSTRELAETYGPLVPDYYDNFTKSTLRLVQHAIQPVSMRMHSIFAGGRGAAVHPWAKNFSFQKPVLLAYNGSTAGLARLLKTARPENQYGTWINVTGFKGDQESSGEYAGYDYREKSVIGGLDRTWKGRFLTGLSLGHAWTSVDVDNQGTGNIDSTNVSLYASYFSPTWYLDGTISYGHHDYDTLRYFTAFSLPVKTISSHQGHSWSFSGEGGYSMQLAHWILQPFAGAHYIALDEDGFTSAGAQSLDVVMKERSTKSLVTDLGGRLGRSFTTPVGSIAPEIGLSWSYDFGLDDRLLSASFAGYQDAAFTIQCRDDKRTMVKMNAGLTFKGRSGFSSSIRYVGGWQKDYRVHGIIGELRIEF